MPRLARFLGTCLMLVVASVAFAQAPRYERVTFARGASDTTVRGTIRGFEAVSYLLAASAGQRLVASFQTDNPRAYLNVTAPGAVEAMFVGATMGNQFDAIIPSTGDYVITVYLARNAALRGEVSNYYLSIGAYGRPLPPPPVMGPTPPAPGGGFWQVTGLAPGDTLNLREQPSTQAMVLLKFYPGQILRDLGCTVAGGMQWCQVQTPDWTSPRGWVAGRYLARAVAPPPYPGYPPVVLPPPPRPPVAGPPRTAKCRQNSTLCTSEAARLCGGSYRVIDSESHAGGLITDAIPGPIIWYTMTYACGPSDGRYPKFSFRGPPPAFPGIGLPGGGGAQPVKVSEMQRYCRGEAASKFRQRPQDIVTEKVNQRDDGTYRVRGRYKDRGKTQTFVCTFGKRGRFQEVVLVSR